MLSGKELQRLLFGNRVSKDEVKIMENGRLTQLMKTNLSTIIPPIQSKFTELELQFSSPRRLYYQMYLTSSDTSIMFNPTVTIPYKGRLQKKWIAFNIRFPCTKQKSGEVTLGIVIDFFFNRRRTRLYKKLNLSMKRQCDTARASESVSSPNTNHVKENDQACKKRCDLDNLKRKFCLSDWVARVKVSHSLPNAKSRYLVRVPRKAILKSPILTHISKRNQVLESRGTALTCDCKPLEIGTKYLIFGKENLDTKKLYLDNYSMAFTISNNDREALNMYRTFRGLYKQILCPPKLWQYRYLGRNLLH